MKAKISPEHKEAFATFTSRPEYQTIINFLKIQKNNIAVLGWTRLNSLDPSLSIKKADFEGQIKSIDMFIRTCEECKKGEDE